MANGESNGHMTDDVTWTWKVKLVTSIRLEPQISKTAGDRDSVPNDHQYGIAYGELTDGVTWLRKVKSWPQYP